MAAYVVRRASLALFAIALAGACSRPLRDRAEFDAGTAGSGGEGGAGGGSGGSHVCLACPPIPVDAGLPPPKPPVGPQLVAGPAHACLVDEGGSLWCWGNNAFGQLGDGTRDDRAAPVRIGSESDWVTVATGGEGCTSTYCAPAGEHTCAIRRDGSLWCWGANAAGQLGDGTTEARLQPTRIGDAADWMVVTAGFGATCGLRAGAGLWCWGGSGWDGSFRPPAPIGDTRPVMVDGATGWIQIAIGRADERFEGGLACGVRASGELWCWTESNFVLPDATRVPRRIGTATDWTAVSVGPNQNGRLCGSRTDGSLACGTPMCDATACTLKTTTLAAAAGWTSPSSSSTHTCAVGRGQLRCWGEDSFGALGTRVAPATSAAALPGEGWEMVAAGDGFTCGRKRDRSLYCWGRNLFGELGFGLPANKQQPTRVDDQKWVSIADGNAWSIAVRDDATLWTWGQGKNIPTRVGQDADWATVSAGPFHACGIRQNGSLWCWYPWGDIRVPTQIGKANEWQEISADRGGACGIRAGTLVCFSDNKWSPAGEDVRQQIAIGGVQPEPIGTDRWSHVATDNEKACGVRDDGTLWCWGLFGRNQEGPFGANVPIPIATAGGWSSIALAGADGCGVRGDGSLACWTLSVDRALVPGDVLAVTPRAQGIDRTWASVRANGGLACAIDTGGGLHCWSYRTGYWSPLTLPGFGTENGPGLIAGEVGWSAVAVGNDHACAIDAAGGLWCWGSNMYGQLGDGSAWRYAPSAPVAFP